MNANRFADPETVGAVAGLMRLLGDPTRIRVLGLLQNGEMNVSALCGKLDLAQPTVSHHLGLLRTAGLVCTRREGKQIHYSLNPDHIGSGDEGRGLRLEYGLVTLCVACCDEEPPEEKGIAHVNGHVSDRMNGHAPAHDVVNGHVGNGATADAATLA